MELNMFKLTSIKKRFEGLSEAESQKEARKVIKEKFSGKVIGKDNKAFVNGTTADEYTHPIKKIDDAEVLKAKMRTSSELDNLLMVSEYLGRRNDGADGHTHKNVEYFDYYFAVFKVGDKYYYGLIDVEKTTEG